MIIFKASSPGKVYWTKDLDDALATAQDWARALARAKMSGEVSVCHLWLRGMDIEKLVNTLNGDGQMKQRYYVRFEHGVPVEEYKHIKRWPRVKNMPVFTTVHPSEKHADWVRTMRSVPGYKDIFQRAPDHRSAIMALRIANADKSTNGHKLTFDIAEYLWKWVNHSVPKRKH